MLDWSISPSYPGNRFKANLLIITCYQLELKEIGLEESLSQLDDIRKTEVLKYLVEIQRSTDYLHQHATSSKLVDICRQCLFHICAKVSCWMQILNEVLNTFSASLFLSDASGIPYNNSNDKKKKRWVGVLWISRENPEVKELVNHWKIKG